MAQRPQAIKLTDAAAEHVKALLAKGGDATAMRLSVETKGCSGLSYRIEYAREAAAGDEVVQDKGVIIYIDPKAVMFVLGTEVDWREDRFQAGFVFTNPMEKGRCGCGESFHV